MFNHHCVLDLIWGDYLGMPHETECNEEEKSSEGTQVLLEMGKVARPSLDHPDVPAAVNQFQQSPS